MNATASTINAASPMYNNACLLYVSTFTVVNRVAISLNNDIAMAALDDTPMSLKMLLSFETSDICLRKV